MNIISNLDENIKGVRDFKISLVLFLFVFSLVSLVWGPAIIGGVFALLLLVFIGWVLSDIELMHPLTWFPPIFFMYSISTPVLVLSGEIDYLQGIEYTILLEWIALVAFILALVNSPKPIKRYSLRVLSNIKKIVSPIYIVSLIMSSIYLLYIINRGLSSKYAIATDKSIFSHLQPFFSIFVLCFLILFTYSIIDRKKKPLSILFIGLGFTFLILIVAGERDLFLRALIGAIFLLHILYKKFKRRYLFLIGGLGVVSISLLNNLKNFVFGTRTIQNKESIIADIFGGEFMSASRNLNTLINQDDMWQPFFGETILWDIKIATIGNATSPGAWFNQIFYPNLVSRGGGNGFTLVGEGYMNFGILGIILSFFLLGVFLRYLHYMAHGNLMWLVIYVTLIPIVIYAIRGDFATILTHFSKHIVLPLLIIYIIKVIVEGRYKLQRLST